MASTYINDIGFEEPSRLENLAPRFEMCERLCDEHTTGQHIQIGRFKHFEGYERSCSQNTSRNPL